MKKIVCRGGPLDGQEVEHKAFYFKVPHESTQYHYVSSGVWVVDSADKYSSADVNERFEIVNPEKIPRFVEWYAWEPVETKNPAV